MQDQMAFVNTIVPGLSGRGGRTPSCTRSSRTRMSSANADGSMTRRTVLHVALGGVLGMGVFGLRSAQAASGDLKEEVKKLDYNEQIFEEGPHDSELQVTSSKKAEAEPEYKDDLDEIKENSKKSFDSMVAEEKAELERVKESLGTS